MICEYAEVEFPSLRVAQLAQQFGSIAVRDDVTRIVAGMTEAQLLENVLLEMDGDDDAGVCADYVSAIVAAARVL